MEKFCDEWLASWRGNTPDNLLSFYADECYYQDPFVKSGLKGKIEIAPYFKKLLHKNPDWDWKRVELIPTQKGFILKWSAKIPFQNRIIEEIGLDIVEIKNGKIIRNEVYFDQSSFRS